MAAATGDMRRALQVCTAALERCRADERDTVTVGHMAAALSAVLKDASKSTVIGLPTQQQLLLAAMLRRCKQANVARCTVSDLRETYVQLCARAHLTPLAEAEVSTVVSVLVDQGLVAIQVGLGVVGGAVGRIPKWDLRIES